MKVLLLLSLLALTCVSCCVASNPILKVTDSDEFVSSDAPMMTSLQQYVATPDSNYAWSRIPQFDEKGLGYEIQWINMTSQRWLTDADVSQSIWWHYVAVVIPNFVNPAFANRGLMYITGGDQDSSPPKITSEDLLIAAILAQECQTVVTVLFQIPNQPVYFWNEQPKPQRRIEDGLIAYAWNQYLNDTSRPEWLPRFPMTKAAIRAMDTVTAYWQQQTGATMDAWIVAGASKRGWTTWTVGACDPVRVVGIIPMVLDELNFVKNIHHHWRAYGGWSFALDDYVKQNITVKFDTDEFAQMMAIVDPIAYTDILTMPKLILSTDGDEFLMPDNNDYYWSELKGEKHFHSLPDAEHSMITAIPEVLKSIQGFVMALQSNTPRPDYYWTKKEDGTIHLEVNAATPPSSVKLWSATTIDGNKRRDFRLVALMNTSGELKPGLHAVIWSNVDLAPISTNSSLIVYEALLAPPTEGWVGFVIEMQWPGFNNTEFHASTAVSILPQTFPFPDCFMETCQGPLV